MAIDRSPSATQFSANPLTGRPPQVEAVEPTDEADDIGAENVASVQYMLRIFGQRYPQDFAALNLTPDVIANQIAWDEKSNTVYLPVIGEDRDATQSALNAWRTFIEFFNSNTTDQEFELELYRPQQ